MHRTERPRFERALYLLNQRSARQHPDEKMAAMAGDWFGELRRFDVRDVEAAITSVRVDAKGFFPGLGQLEKACIRITTARLDKERRENGNGPSEERRAEIDASTAEHAAEYLGELPPDDPTEHEAWIAAGKSKADRVCRWVLAHHEHATVTEICRKIYGEL